MSMGIMKDVSSESMRLAQTCVTTSAHILLMSILTLTLGNPTHMEHVTFHQVEFTYQSIYVPKI